jgi:hypothetical protein
MSYLNVAPELVAAAASDLAGIGATVNAANAATLAPRTPATDSPPAKASSVMPA